jgi:4'-phosphopantetheinyl transferase
VPEPGSETTIAAPSMTLGAIPAPGTLAAPTGLAVQIWWARVEVGELDEDLRAALAADLNPETITRLDRFHRVQDRDRGLAAHALLRRVLAAVAGGRPSELSLRTRCAACGETDHGKPYLDVGAAVAPVEVNLSHSGPVVCLALTAPGVEVGVDVEQRRPVDWATLRRSVFADAEWLVTEGADDPDRRRMDGWARKESSVKASGHGLSLPLRQVLVVEAAWGGWTATLPGESGSTAGWDLSLAVDVAAAVAIHDPERLGRPEPPVVRQVSLEPVEPVGDAGKSD